MNTVILPAGLAVVTLAFAVIYAALCESHNSKHTWLKELAIRCCYQKDRVSMNQLTRIYHLCYREAVIYYHHYQIGRYIKWDHR